MSQNKTFVLKGNKPLGAAFSHARKVAAKTGGGKKKEREVANRYLNRQGEKPIGKSAAAISLRQYLQKGGEGSRGGKIIGHTRSGKPVYSRVQATGYGKDFNSLDHEDAAKIHTVRAKHHAKVSDEAASSLDLNNNRFERHGEWADHHEFMSENHLEQAAKRKSSVSTAAKKVAKANNKSSTVIGRVTMAKSTIAAVDLLGEHLAKAVGRTGEGSRGGKIIGHTRTGKPIYATAGAGHAKYSNFTNDDHRDAMQAHEDLRGHLESRANTARADGNHREAKMTDRSAARHEDIAGDHSRTARIGVASSPKVSTAPSGSGGKMMRTADGINMYVPGKDGSGRSAPAKKTPKSDMNAQSKLGFGMGLTSSGKSVSPIDGPDHAIHKEFTAQDHQDAGDMHHSAANRYEDENEHDLAGHHMKLAQKHYARAETKTPAVAPTAPKKDRSYHGTAAGLHDRIADHHSQLSEMAMDHGDDDAEMEHRLHADHHRALARGHRAKAESASKSDSTNDFSAADVLGAYLAKGGEGTRGGKIIGHTSSGKPIYASHQASHSSYKGFTHQDHAEAHELHYAMADKHDESQPRRQPVNEGLNKLARQHEAIAESHFKAGRKLERSDSAHKYGEFPAADGSGVYLIKGGEGTRGGKIIGHTKSGKPIYQNSHADRYKGFSHQDHLDAMHAHDTERLKAEKKAVGFHSHAQKMIADFHDQASRSHENAASKEDYMGKSGEGTRGGKIIGHTKSGKPIYEKGSLGSPQHRGFSSADHRDARNAHSELGQKLSFDAVSQKLSGSGSQARKTKASADHHWSMAAMHAGEQGRLSRFGKSDGDGDAAHEFADINNMDPDRILVRPVMDVENSPLNDAIAAAWPGMPFVAQAASNFCAMDTQGKLGI